ncbi:MAG: cation transporter [Thermoleophilaceae bacterium]|nr:cation transporter [Thermoleophilaceae bacterium]
MTTAEKQTPTAVLHVGGMYRGSENAVVETVLARRPGVLDVEGNAAGQSATVPSTHR